MRSTAGFIYAIGAEGSPHVKIGKTTGAVAQRLKLLQTGYPAPLHIIASVAVATNVERVEKRIHMLLTASCSHGEWFAVAMDQTRLESLVALAVQYLKQDDACPRAITMMSLGREIKKARIEKGWMQRKLYEETGISQKYLSEIENDHVDPRFSIVQRIAVALGIGLDQLGKTDAPG